MKIVLINPNTTHAMTMRMYKAVKPLLSAGVELTPLTAASGMASIEGYFDEAFVIQPMIEVIKPMADEIDGVVVNERELARSLKDGIAARIKKDLYTSC